MGKIKSTEQEKESRLKAKSVEKQELLGGKEQEKKDGIEEVDTIVKVGKYLLTRLRRKMK